MIGRLCKSEVLTCSTSLPSPFRVEFVPQDTSPISLLASPLRTLPRGDCIFIQIVPESSRAVSGVFLYFLLDRDPALFQLIMWSPYTLSRAALWIKDGFCKIHIQTLGRCHGARSHYVLYGCGWIGPKLIGKILNAKSSNPFRQTIILRTMQTYFGRRTVGHVSALETATECAMSNYQSRRVHMFIETAHTRQTQKSECRTSAKIRLGNNHETWW